jgi:hypothetical protein
MKFFKLDLLTLLISLFILSSCKNQDTIGLGVTSATQLSGSLIDTSTIVVNTIPEDSVMTSTLGTAPMGYFKDPVLGNTESNIAMDLNLPGSGAYTVPTGTNKIDSVILIVRYGNGFYGDSLSSRYKVNVYQLNEKINPNTNYYNTRAWNYNSGTLLGTKTFFSRTHDSIYVNAIVTNKPDSLLKVPAQLRIPISPSFVNTNLFFASAAQLGSNLVFKNNVHGLYLTMDKAGSAGAGGTFMMALDSGVNITVYYKNTNGSTIDTTTVSLPAATVHAVQIKHTYSTAVQTELNNAATGSRNAVYLQGNAGLRAKISFPYLRNIAKTLGTNIVINRAELVITPASGSIIPFPPLPQINMYQYDIAHQRTYLQDSNTGDPRAQGLTVFGGYYSTIPIGYVTPSVAGYHFVITAYVQDLIRGASIDNGTFIGAVDPASTVSSAYLVPTAQVSSRSVLIGTDKTSPYRMKLNIIYTKLPK